MKPEVVFVYFYWTKKVLCDFITPNVLMIPCIRFYCIALLLIFLGCRSSEKKITDSKTSELPVINENNKDTAVSYVDSVQIVKFFFDFPQLAVYKNDLFQFYRKRNQVCVWKNRNGMNEYAGNLINLLKHEEISGTNSSPTFYDKLYSLYAILIEQEHEIKSKNNLQNEIELLLTISFFDYARRNWKGINDKDLKRTNWFIERKKINPEDLLDTIFKADSLFLFSFEPVYRQYGLLKSYLKKYNALQKNGGWISWDSSMTMLKNGDSSELVKLVKKQLFLTGDLAIEDSSQTFDNTLTDAVMQFQLRHGLNADGRLNQSTWYAIKVPLSERIRQILINMERYRWVPVELMGDYLAVNIPDFKLHVFHNDTLQWSCKVVVGKSKASSHTVIFNDYLEYIVFFPYWNIPENILIKETLPAIKKDADYLKKHNMEIISANGQRIEESDINWKIYTSNFPYIIRQRPGKNNALGLVKFLFPNSYDIYMHDTPEKSLFDETKRTFSHGCIRVEEPYKLASYLLREDTEWTDKKINDLLHGGKQTTVKLKNKIPVFITYFTAWVDRKGKLNFREDVYQHDKKMTEILFGN